MDDKVYAFPGMKASRQQQVVSRFAGVEPVTPQRWMQHFGFDAIPVPQAFGNLIADRKYSLATRWIERGGIEIVDQLSLVVKFARRLWEGRIEHVVEHANGVHEVAHMPRMSNEPSGRFGRDNQVEIRYIQIVAGKVVALDLVEVRLICNDGKLRCIMPGLAKSRD